MTEPERFAQAAADACEELADRRDELARHPERAAEIVQRALILLGSMAMWLRAELDGNRGRLR